MTRDEFDDKYSEIAAFLGNFEIQTHLDKSDDEVMNEAAKPIYYQDQEEKYGKTALKEAKEVLELDPFPAKAIEFIAMTWFEDKDNTKKWFASIVEKLEKKINEAEKNSTK